MGGRRERVRSKHREEEVVEIHLLNLLIWRAEVMLLTDLES